MPAAAPSSILKLKRCWTTIKRPSTGIFEGSLPFPSSIYALDGEHVYQWWHAGWATTVYAGAYSRHPQEGIVIVLDSPYPLRVSLIPNPHDLLAPDPSRATVYRTPIPGSVYIKSSRGQVITLVAYPSDRRMTFDVRTRRFAVKQ